MITICILAYTKAVKDVNWRKRILEKMGKKVVDCWVPSRELTEKEVEELNIRHNKNTGDWDDEILANQWESYELMEWGFTHEELGINLEEGTEEKELGDELDLENPKTCPTCKRPLE